MPGSHLLCVREVLQEEWEQLLLLLCKMQAQGGVDLLYFTRQQPMPSVRHKTE